MQDLRATRNVKLCVTIDGASLSGAACAALLVRSGVPVFAAPAARGGGFVGIHEFTAGLLRDFDNGHDTLSGHGHVLESHRISWNAPETVLARRSIVISRAMLAGIFDRAYDAPVREEHWAVYSSQTEAKGEQVDCGSRRVISAQVRMRPGFDERQSAMEAITGAWLFLLPIGNRQAIVQAGVPGDGGAPLQDLLESSRLVGPRVDRVAGATESVSGAPSFAALSCGPGWLAVGNRAISADPLCGDGVGFGLRTAALAAGTLVSICDGVTVDQCLAHYRGRLTSAVQTHLTACVNFYSQTGDPCWDFDIEAMKRGLRQLSQTRSPATMRLRVDAAGRPSVESQSSAVMSHSSRI